MPQNATSFWTCEPDVIARVGGGDQAKSLRNRLTRMKVMLATMKERRATTKESRRQLTPPEKTAGDSGRNRVG
ncbi:hypothetical protein BTW08_03505 [Salinicola sp. MH3R3-1]|nr:hypothetical protein BTW08_03505 [Salinicola sp. MH3R3-1]